MPIDFVGWNEFNTSTKRPILCFTSVEEWHKFI